MLRASRLPRAAAVAAASALVLTACVAPKEQTTLPEPDPAVPGEVPGEELAGRSLEEFYGQDVAWTDCGGGYECATVLAPLDWDAPETGAIELAAKRHPAEGGADERVGSLLINPGGPGSSGVEFLPSFVGVVAGDDLLAAYDVVGFDPRGVGGSTAVECGPDDVVDGFLTSDTPIESAADLEAARELVRAFGEVCLEHTGPLLGEIDTVSAARDMDLLRAVLGDEQLHYAGFSYGTFLGATYADLYPESVGRMLLDGAIDPSLSGDEVSLGQAVGFESSLRAYVEHCMTTSQCPLSGSVEEGMAQVAELVDRAEATPIPAGDAEVNGTLAFYGIVVTLYDDASWRFLSMAIEEVLRAGTAALLLELANFYLDRTADGRYTSNSMVAFSAINCLDYPLEERSYEDMLAFAEQLEEVAPTFGRDFALAAGCETWPIEPTGERRALTAEGAAPILVVGTTGDPATPYEWSVALADQLASGRLLTWEGEGHTAYGRAGACVSDVVEDYLVRGQVPESDVTC